MSFWRQANPRIIEAFEDTSIRVQCIRGRELCLSIPRGGVTLFDAVDVAKDRLKNLAPECLAGIDRVSIGYDAEEIAERPSFWKRLRGFFARGA